MKIVAENITKKFDMNDSVTVTALHDVSLHIKSGESVAITGPSGAGKSTLIHILGLMDRPSNGRLLLDGADFTEKNDETYAKARNKDIGFMFQMHYLLPDFTVLENVMIPVWEHKSDAKAKALLKELGLGERMEHMPSELSGGEQQRVALARALVHDPKIVFADEPTGNVDRETGEQVEKLLFDECKRKGITLVLVTHNSELASKADRIIKMRDGKIE
jgi:ABC-type lipoprotein export system ATPase subunit